MPLRRPSPSRRPMLRSIAAGLCPVLGVLLLLGPPPAQTAVAAPQESGPAAQALDEAVDPLARVALVGASATAGFNLNSELGRAADLQEFFERALAEPAGAVLDASDTTLFSSPLKKGGRSLGEALAFEPTATLAVDLPFWFVHGPYANDDARREAFDWLLEKLDGSYGTIVLGTVPTMGPEVAEWMVPRRLKAADEVVAWANQRLRAWADERDHVLVVPMAEFLADLREGRDLTLREQTFDGDDVEEFLQDDGLHPTVMGTAALTMLMLDALDRHADGALEDRVKWDVEDLAAAVEDAEVDPGGGAR